MHNAPTAGRAGAEARALKAALALVSAAGWRPTPVDTSLPQSFAHFLYVADAELLIEPTSAGLHFACKRADAAIRLARADAIIVSSAYDEVNIAVARWSSAKTHWYAPANPWRSPTGALWLPAMDPHTHALPDTGFPLSPGRLKPQPAPWRDAADLASGQADAAAWLAAAMGR